VAAGKTTAMDVPEVAERVLGEGTFTVEKFAASFGVLVEAAGGMERLRGAVFDLAILGRLHRHVTSDGAVSGLGNTPLPAGWRWERLGALVSVIRGVSYPKSDAQNSRAPGLSPLLRANSISSNGLLFEDLVYVPTKHVAPEQMLRVNDILVAMASGSRALVGKAAQLKAAFVGTFGAFCGVVRPNQDDTAPFLALFMSTPFYRSRIAGQSKGIGINNLRKQDIESIPVPLPPLAEQKRIVARVDQIMALIDQLEAKQNRKHEVGARFTKASLEALTTAENPEAFESLWERVRGEFPIVIRQLSDVQPLRSTIIGLACGGWLSSVARTPEWGNGADLVGSILKSRHIERAKLLKNGARPASLPQDERVQFSEPPSTAQIPSSWTICGIEDLLACVPNALKAGPFGSALTKSMYVSRGYKVYGQEQVISGDHRIGSYYIDRAKFDSLKSCAVAPGDMLVSLMGTVGKTLVLPGDCEPGIINPRLLKLSIHKSMSADYLRLCFQSPQSQRFLLESARGVAMDGLNLGILRQLPILLPPLPEQMWLLAKVEHLMKLCDALEAALRRSEDRAAKLVEAVVQEMVA